MDYLAFKPFSRYAGNNQGVGGKVWNSIAKPRPLVARVLVIDGRKRWNVCH
jgi:hypothetical protein